jgi:hypothetical protein
MTSFTPLIEWAIRTGRLESGLLARMSFVQQLVDDEERAVRSVLAARATRRSHEQPPAPWGRGVAAAGAVKRAARQTEDDSYPESWLSAPERAGVEGRRAEQERIAAAGDPGYPREWLSPDERDHAARAAQGLPSERAIRSE